MTDQNALATVSNYMRSDMVRARFADTIGDHNAGPFITSVLLAVANSDALQQCDPRSIYSAALRAATLRLSCDPATKQAYLVPFGKNATLIVGAKGLYDLAMRTNRYRWINVSPLFEGEEIIFDRISGKATIGGGKTGNRVVAYVAAFEMTNGYSKVISMTVDEIHEHARKYSKGYSKPNGPWQTATEAMERKTVLRNLLQNWGYLDPADQQALHTSDEEVIEAEIQDAPELPEDYEEPEREHQSAAEALEQLGF